MDKRSAMQGLERAIARISPETPAPQYQPTERNKRKTVEDKKWNYQLRLIKSIGTALKTRQSPTIGLKDIVGSQQFIE